jgi:hypothetical protein
MTGRDVSGIASMIARDRRTAAAPAETTAAAVLENGGQASVTA